ncbi:oligopeptide transporter, OPT family [candidate division KSB1 bacterium]|nr:oligopeptide transporter, OPT family [candidate division KSB1 bacterium]
MEERKVKGLPPNAYTPLKEGEKYIPYIPAEERIPEVTRRSVLIGVLMAVLFSFAACYLGLVAGQVFEAAIPIAILAVGIAGLYTRRSTISENVIIQSIGAASGVVVAGAIFTLPALYILGLKVSLLHSFIACSLGGFAGILFLIPLRRYFCVEEHGKLPFPEAVATTEILATGETGGKAAKVLAISMVVGGIYDFLVEAMHVWPKQIRTDAILGKLGATLADKTRWIFKLDATAALFGLGYIVGIKYASIIAAGSVLSFLVFLPLVYHFGQHFPDIIGEGKIPIAQMTELEVFSIYVQKIGIGAIAMAGFIGIAKMGKIIVTSFSVGLREIFRGTHAEGESVPRTDTDMHIKNTILFIVGTLLLILIAFWFFASPAGTMGFALKVAVVGLVIVAVLAFLFTPVAARAIAIVGVNPVSGMTLITLIISALVLLAVGLDGVVGMTVALIMGCVVCTSLSMSGGFITDLKIGYWLGNTPRNQQRWKFLGVIVSAISVSLAILLIQKSYGFTIGGSILEGGVPNPAIPAPQGNLMAVIIRSLMIEAEIPYLLFALGALCAILLEMAGVPPLAFALGMYLPIQINMPVFAGGIVSWLVIRLSKKREKEPGGSSPKERGTLIASGFIAGGALMGVMGALLNLPDIGKPVRFISIGAQYVRRVVEETGKVIWEIDSYSRYFESLTGQLLSLAGFVGLCLFCYYYAKGRAIKKE